MQEVLVTLVIVVIVLGGAVAVYTLATSGQVYREMSKGGLDVPAAADEPAPPLVPDDRDEEIRELLVARNARRAERGEPPLDVDAELAALVAGGRADQAAAGDAAGPGELRDELRALVEARNRRRERAGLEPLDVDSEIERRVRDLN